MQEPDLKKVAASPPQEDQKDLITEQSTKATEDSDHTKTPSQKSGEGGSFALPSLSSLKSKINEKPEVTEEAADPEAPIEDDSNQPFTEEDLNEKWQAFALSQKEAGKDQAYVTLMEPFAVEGNKVLITLSNEVLKITFDKLKADLQGYLRNELNNKAIVLEAEVKETQREDMIYTNKEKFNYLAKKHPALEELQKRLGLDPDY